MKYYWLGLLPYQQALALQQRLHEACRLEQRSSCVLLLEHPPLISFGKNADSTHLLLAPSDLAAQGVEIFRCDRGGEVTAHMPGQLVVYPIFSFKEHPMGVKTYINLLEEVVIRTLDTFGISSHRSTRNPGVWVHDKKICALGIRISQRIAMHGLALNIANDLRLFSAMHPCGLSDCYATSMQEHLVAPPSVEEVAGKFMQNFAAVFGQTMEKGLASEFS